MLRVIFLTSIWVLAWGRLSVANVAGGILVSGALLLLYPIRSATTGTRRFSRPRPVACLRLLGAVLVELFVSNAQVAREVVTRRSRIRTGIVACRLRTDSEPIITFLAAVLSLSPGTMPVQVEAEPGVIYVHVLHLYDVEATRRAVARLEALTIRAIGTPEAVARLEAASRPTHAIGHAANSAADSAADTPS